MHVRVGHPAVGWGVYSTNYLGDPQLQRPTHARDAFSSVLQLIDRAQPLLGMSCCRLSFPGPLAAALGFKLLRAVLSVDRHSALGFRLRCRSIQKHRRQILWSKNGEYGKTMDARRNEPRMCVARVYVLQELICEYNKAPFGACWSRRIPITARMWKFHCISPTKCSDFLTSGSIS